MELHHWVTGRCLFQNPVSSKTRPLAWAGQRQGAEVKADREEPLATAVHQSAVSCHWHSSLPGAATTGRTGWSCPGNTGQRQEGAHNDL